MTSFVTTPEKASVRCCKRGSNCVSVVLGSDPNSTKYTFQQASAMCKGETVDGKTPMITTYDNKTSRPMEGSMFLPDYVMAISRKNDVHGGTLGSGRGYDVEPVWISEKAAGTKPIAIQACGTGFKPPHLSLDC